MILVTGASEGIGYECARALLERNECRVLITGRSADKLRRAHAGVPEAQRERLATFVCDQARRTEVEALMAFLADADRPLSGAILSVGVNPLYGEGPRRIHSLEPETIEATIRTNCTHTLLLTTILLDRFRRRRSGVLVWIGSQAARNGMPGAGLYCATKSFLAGLAYAAHHEYAGHNVRVHLVNPGIVRTPRTATTCDRFAAAHGLVVSEAADVARRIVDLFHSGRPAPMEVDL